MKSALNAVKLRSGKWVSAEAMVKPFKGDGIIRTDDTVSVWKFTLPNNIIVRISNLRLPQQGSTWEIWDSVSDKARGEFKTYEEALAALQEEIDAGNYDSTAVR